MATPANAPPLFQPPKPATPAPAPVTPAAPKPFDPTQAWSDQQALQQAKLKNLEDQVGQYGMGVTDLQRAQEAARSSLRARSDQALAGSRGMLGGGRGLAMLQQGALTRGAAEGEQLMGQAGAMQAARLQKLGAEGELLGEKAKILQQGALSKTRANAMVQKAKDMATEEAGKQWFTFNAEDRARVAKRIQQELLDAEADPAVREALKMYIDSLLTGKENQSGVVDT